MASSFGDKIKFIIFGQSHGEAIGVVIDGLPAGEVIDLDELDKFLDRRRTGKNALSTQRKEADKPVFLSGVREINNNLETCGSPLCAIIKNLNAKSQDYAELLDKPRPGHADYTAYIKWNGKADMRGGGHFSGRLTAPLCIAGGIAKQILARRNIFVVAHLLECAKVRDKDFKDLELNNNLFENIAAKEFPVIDDLQGEKMQQEILKAREEGDSVGGIIECAVINLPAGLGEPMFDGIESKLAKVLFGVPAVKGVEFGIGFDAARLKGSENNDEFRIINNKVMTQSNNSGGILGGITNGMPVIFRAAIKPTPSISKPQNTISLSKLENSELVIKGRHDPCIAHRAVPVIEAAAACVILDLLA
ncbi:MAG: chorismate synthase [Synergistaceae bacterium]|nr:chorismate synthase [Synergistaceae bacterium]